PAATHESDVIGDGRRRRRQRDAELRKLALDCSGHDGLLPRSAADRHKFSPIARRGASGGVPVGRAQVARRRFGSYVDRTGERKATPAMIRARLAAAAAICSAVVLVPPAFGQAAGVVLAPHRAVYDLSLLRSQGKRPVAAVRGRILYDFSGSACAGYALNFRQVSELDTGEGKTALSDLRANTWEEGAAKRFKFSSQNYVNEKVVETVDGSAERNTERVTVKLAKPADKSFDLDPTMVFPSEQMRRIIATAREGKTILELPVYDGSETGEKSYTTLTVIGHEIPAGEKKPTDAAGGEAALAGLKRWPVTVSYFDKSENKRSEQTPVYSLTFELYQNGVSRALALDYGDFVVAGEMSQLEMKDAPACK